MRCSTFCRRYGRPSHNCRPLIYSRGPSNNSSPPARLRPHLHRPLLTLRMIISLMIRGSAECRSKRSRLPKPRLLLLRQLPQHRHHLHRSPRMTICLPACWPSMMQATGRHTATEPRPNHRRSPSTIRRRRHRPKLAMNLLMSSRFPLTIGTLTTTRAAKHANRSISRKPRPIRLRPSVSMKLPPPNLTLPMMARKRPACPPASTMPLHSPGASMILAVMLSPSA